MTDDAIPGGGVLDPAPAVARPVAGFDLSSLFKSGGSADQILAQALVDSGSHFSGNGLRGIVYIDYFNPELGQIIRKESNKWRNVKVIAQALASASLIEMQKRIPGLMGGGGK